MASRPPEAAHEVTRESALVAPAAATADLDVSRVTTLLCDADGNLFASEEPAFEASVVVTNRLLARLGSERRYVAEELRRQALGRNFRSLAEDLAAAAGVRLDAAELEEWVAEEARLVTEHLAAVLAPDPATQRAVRTLAGHFRLAVVSSSALARLAACFAATGLDDAFPDLDRLSAQDSLPVPTSKPDPAVYRHALEHLAVRPEEALAVEDAVSGVRSAVAAGIRVVGNLVHVPPAEREGHERALRDAGAAAVVADWEELVRLLLGEAAGRPC